MIIPPGAAGTKNGSDTKHSDDDDDDDDAAISHSSSSSSAARRPSDQQPSDHPLSDGPDSAWSTYFKDNEVLLQIDRDVRRLCPDMSFFQQATEHPCAAIVDGEGRRLHARVTPSVLNSANVERKGLGLTKV